MKALFSWGRGVMSPPRRIAIRFFPQLLCHHAHQGLHGFVSLAGIGGGEFSAPLREISANSPRQSLDS